MKAPEIRKRLKNNITAGVMLAGQWQA